ncbi:MAG: DUF512 domain-containing protein [Clostridia bacterium]|nr:DUF512 domain-containing protein [Clostridia bacterium]MBQ3869198.1 DUF512 domain-containing protein [Clostridia bacterium]
MVRIESVIPGSPADKAGMTPGDELISVNGNDVSDVLDYRFYINEPRLTVLFHRGSDLMTAVIDKDEYEDPGLEFKTYLMDEKRRCKNACIFCFIDQMPKGCRESLYFKDDDDRLSFLQGNYITTTNLTENEIDRIIKMHLSPINISVHTTDPELRVFMMKNKNAGKVLSIMKRFAEAGITMNGQIVLCKDINDKEHLDRSMKDLEGLYPALQSVSIVPCGLTAHRQGLYKIEPFDKADCAAVIKQVERFSDSCKKKYGERIFFCADEFYIKAEKKLHPASYYEGYPQYENGVGMIACLYDELKHEMKGINSDLSGVRVTLITGEAAYAAICDMAAAIQRKTGLCCLVRMIKNEFFGGAVTVAGLVVGRDIIKQLEGCDLGSALFLPSVMLRAGEDVFLDDTTLSELEEKLGVPVVRVTPDASAASEICEYAETLKKG